MNSYTIIRHRVNTIEELECLDPIYGAEIDLRDRGSRLILAHDPFSEGIDFADFLKHYRHNTLILNIKSEGVEYRVLKEIEASGNVKDFFFLDSSFPMIRKLIATGERRIAMRLSEYESIDSIMTVARDISWVWIDCFTRMPLTHPIYSSLRDHNLNLCIVSPELQSWQDGKVMQYRRSLAEFPFHAVCTKQPAVWS